ncbi:MAG: TonB-dependent receptor [Bacteroidia bacterium]|nr:TonB-dependent receptor [Bacteroidia bacterium]
MRTILFLILFTAGSGTLLAQTLTQTVRGTVIDADSKSPIPGVAVKMFFGDSVKTSTSDADGKFRIREVPVGRHRMTFSFIGYEERKLDNLVVGTGKEVILQIELTESVIMSDEVQIYGNIDQTKANNDLVTNSSRNFQSEETERYAGSRADPSKMVANYAGVASANDLRNDIIVRGNSPLGVLWRLEGLDIPNPNHFSNQGATGGPISILNNNLLAGSDFLTGAFPAEYGNKSAAVFDLRLKNGNNEKYEFTSQIGFNGFELGAEGPISKKQGSSFIAAYRYSTFAFFDLIGVNFGVSGIPEYSDATVKFNIPTKKAGQFSLWGIGGKSHIELLDSERDTTNWALTDGGEDLIFGSNMFALGMNHVYFFTPDISGKFSAGFTRGGFSAIIDTLSSTKVPFRVYTNESSEDSHILSYVLTWKMNARHLFKTGINYSGFLFDYHTYFWSRKSLINVDQLKQNDGTGVLQSFLHWQYRINEKHSMNTGIHHQYLVLNGRQIAEPRIGWRFQFKKNQSLSLAGGIHSQTAPMLYYFYKTYDTLSQSYTQSNLELDFSKSVHAVAGYDLVFKKDFRMKAEVYYQYLFHIPIDTSRNSTFSLINSGNDIEGLPLMDSLYNSGTGSSRGIEFTFEKFFSKRYYFLTSVSLYQSDYSAADGKIRPTAFSGGYVYNQLAGYELPVGKKKNVLLELDMKFTLAAGNRYTPIDLVASAAENSAVYSDSLAFSEKFKDYSRLDLKVSVRINRKKTAHYLFLNVENVTDRKNVLRQIYDPKTSTIVEEYQLGVFPYGGYRIEF